ncbi:hypothetical protein HDU86_007779 [Geranomyces michiganensis]|nr:hypothetical protein HDU86_007779 [Geranomyces michiganensis]
MVSSKTAAALLLVASAGSAMAAIPASGVYGASSDATTTTTLGKFKACDKACLTSFSVAANTAGTALNMKGNAAADSQCTCTQNTIPYDAAKGLVFSGVTFSTTGDTFSGNATAVAAPGGGGGGGATTTTKKAGGAGGQATSAASPSPSAAAEIIVRRRRAVFKRAVGDSLTLMLTPAGGSASAAVYTVTSDTPVGVTAPSSSQKLMYAGAAIFSAGVAAVVAGLASM